MKKIIVYATTQGGEGKVYKVGEYEEVSEIIISCGMFTDDVEISFEEKEE